MLLSSQSAYCESGSLGFSAELLPATIYNPTRIFVVVVVVVVLGGGCLFVFTNLSHGQSI